MPDINGFSPFLGDIGHFWSPNFGRKLEMNNQLQIYINQAWLRPWKSVKAELCWREAKPKPFLCREDIEEQTLSGHFWELRTSVLRVVFFAWFSRFGRTWPYQYCSHLALQRCTFELLNRNKEASPTETKARRCGKVVPNSVINLCVMVCCLLFHFRSICVYGCHNSSLFLILSLSFSNG